MQRKQEPKGEKATDQDHSAVKEVRESQGWFSLECLVMFNLLFFKKKKKGVPVVAQRKCIRLGTVRLQVRSLASLSRLRIPC